MIRKTSQNKERFRGERLGRKSKKGMPKREKLNKEEQCKLNDDLCDAKNKYDTLLAQSEKDKKSIGKLGQQLSAQ